MASALSTHPKQAQPVEPERFITLREMVAENQRLTEESKRFACSLAIEQDAHETTREELRASKKLSDARYARANTQQVENDRLDSILIALAKEGGEKHAGCRGTMLELNGIFDELNGIELEQELDAFGRDNFEECDAENCFGGYVIEVVA